MRFKRLPSQPQGIVVIAAICVKAGQSQLSVSHLGLYFQCARPGRPGLGWKTKRVLGNAKEVMARGGLGLALKAFLEFGQPLLILAFRDEDSTVEQQALRIS